MGTHFSFLCNLGIYLTNPHTGLVGGMLNFDWLIFIELCIRLFHQSALMEKVFTFFWFPGICGTVAVVNGTYSYHHYMQDNFNDDVCILNQDLLAVESFFGKGGGGLCWWLESYSSEIIEAQGCKMKLVQLWAPQILQHYNHEPKLFWNWKLDVVEILTQPFIGMHILHTIFCTFLEILTRRICWITRCIFS